mmetsp:Transcript_2349/g.3180  ORF Transcript_2349/g.3180 Transcript_2349/m.3180 type:complete len:104 (-) Transcript_2349:68-379(-)
MIVFVKKIVRREGGRRGGFYGTFCVNNNDQRIDEEQVYRNLFWWDELEVRERYEDDEQKGVCVMVTVVGLKDLYDDERSVPILCNVVYFVQRERIDYMTTYYC